MRNLPPRVVLDLLTFDASNGVFVFVTFPPRPPLAMSSNELAPLFPSATHPALPVATQILSTLRHLTAPGKGNELKPEERPALVGIAALLGCER